MTAKCAACNGVGCAECDGSGVVPPGPFAARPQSRRPEVRVGQRWKERDARFNRVVKVVAIEGERVRIDSGVRQTWARLDRFGRGYDLVE